MAVAERDGSFTITGRKTFTTMAPALRFIMVSATIKTPDSDVEEAGQFLLEAGLPGMRIEETWDTVGMRATGSHDLVLDGVRAPASAVLSRRPYPSAPVGASSGAAPAAPIAPVEPSATPTGVLSPAATGARVASGSAGSPPLASAWSTQLPPEGAGWALLVPAVYLGIATAARNEAVTFARTRRPQPLGGKAIGELPAVQQLLGEIEIALAESRSLLFGVAEAWVEAPQRRTELTPLLAAAKYVATNRGVEITDKAMRVVGGAGLARTQPVQRYYRDVRAGLHHPPMDDVALGTLARAALNAPESGDRPLSD
jgi:alkylation response protein AidB-like acyl-CoA dehydrogenase